MTLNHTKKMIENELNEAKKLREEAQAELNASLKKQKEINKQVLDIINDAKSTAKQIETDALKKSDVIIKRKEEQAKQKILSLEADAIRNIKEITSSIVVESSKTFIKQNLDNKENVNLISKSSNEIKSSIIK